MLLDFCDDDVGWNDAASLVALTFDFGLICPKRFFYVRDSPLVAVETKEGMHFALLVLVL